MRIFLSNYRLPKNMLMQRKLKVNILCKKKSQIFYAKILFTQQSNSIKFPVTMKFKVRVINFKLG